jgi:hypothetical protein
MLLILRLEGAEHRAAGAHHVHGMRALGQLLESHAKRGGKRPEGLQLCLVLPQFVAIRELLVDQQVGHFLELGLVGEVEDVVAAVVQVVAGAPDGAKRGVAGGDAGQGDGFLGLGGCGGGRAHFAFENSSSSFFS